MTAEPAGSVAVLRADVVELAHRAGVAPPAVRVPPGMGPRESRATAGHGCASIRSAAQAPAA
jgi:hypothetical protein